MPGIEFKYTAGEETFARGFSEEFQDENIRIETEINERRVYARLIPAGPVSGLSFRLTMDCLFSDDERFLLNGWQSWTDTYELRMSDRQHSVARLPRFVRDGLALTAYGDEGFYPGPFARGVFHGWSYAVCRRGEEYTLYGSMTEREAFTAIEFDTHRGKLSFARDLDGLTVSEPFALLDIRVYTGSEAEVYDAWFADLGIHSRARGSVRGYTSWYRWYQDIDSGKILKSLASAANTGMDIFQIDDGYESAVGDWLDPDPTKFPDGMAEIARRIHENGQRAGIWLAPFVCEKKSRLFREHPDWLLTEEDNTPVKAGHNWGGSYALDFSRPEVRNYIARVIKTVTEEWGYDLLKLDFLYAAAIRPVNERTRGARMSEAMDFLRELAGDKEILACGVPLAPAFGVADYCRIGTDVTLDWQNKWYFRALHREHASTKLSILNSAFRYPLDGRAFGNDPDVFILREGARLTDEQKEILSLINHVKGSLVFTSDDEADYSPEARRLLSRHEALAARSIYSRAEKDGPFLLLKTADESIRIDMKRGKIIENF